MDGETNDSSASQNYLWDNATTRLLISTRLKYEKEFRQGRTRKTLLWDTVLNDMRRANPNLRLSTLELTKKFNNLLVTYKRIKNRSHLAGGEVKTSWEYFDSFDAVCNDLYTKSESPPISGNHTGTFADPLECSNDGDDDDDDDWSEFKIEPSSSRTSGNRSNVSRKDCNGGADTTGRNTVDIGVLANYLKDYDAKCERRHRQNLKVEIKKIKIEEEKLKVLTEIRDILKEIRY